MANGDGNNSDGKYHLVISNDRNLVYQYIFIGYNVFFLLNWIPAINIITISGSFIIKIKQSKNMHTQNLKKKSIALLLTSTLLRREGVT